MCIWFQLGVGKLKRNKKVIIVFILTNTNIDIFKNIDIKFYTQHIMPKKDSNKFQK